MTVVIKKEMERVISKDNPLDMVYSIGCINSELSVNGINEVDMTDEQRRIVMERMMSYYMEHLESLRGYSPTTNTQS